MAFLVDRVRGHARCTTPPWRSSSRGGGFDYDRLRRADRGPDRVRAALPAAAPHGARPARQPGVGRRRRLRPRPTTYGAPRCRGRGPWTSCASWSPGSSSRPLDRHRPLWEMYFIEGLEGGRFAILSKSHQILVDGVATIDLGQVILDDDPRTREAWCRDEWQPRRAAARRPGRRGGRATASRAPGDRAEHGPRQRRRPSRPSATAARRSARSPAPCRTAARPRRRRSTRRCRSSAGSSRCAPSSTDYRKVRRFHGGTVNDVVLATVTGALRGWLMTRAESVHGEPRSCARWCR